MSLRLLFLRTSLRTASATSLALSSEYIDLKAKSESNSTRNIRCERRPGSISMVTLAELESIPVDTTIVGIKIAVRRLLRSDFTRSTMLKL
jgi:hypothetical protein